MHLFLLGAAENFSLLLPLGLLLGVVLALGRLYHDSEMTAAQACGYGRGRAWFPVIVLALPVAALSAWLNLQFAPQAAQRRVALTAEAVRAGLAVPITPGDFAALTAGVRWSMRAPPMPRACCSGYSSSRAATGRAAMRPWSRRSHSEPGARSARTDSARASCCWMGNAAEGVPGTRRYRFLRFAELRVPLAIPEPVAQGQRLDERETADLIGSTATRDRAELQWRWGFPVMVLVAAGCAMAIGRLRPRQGRYERVWPAVMIFALYGNLAIAARTWYEHGVSPSVLGIWWVHVPIIALCLWLARKYA